MQPLNQFIRHCGFIVGLVRAGRTGVLDAKLHYFHVLKPGGRIRLTTPDLQVLARLCAPRLGPIQTNYPNFIADQLFPEIKTMGGVFAINIGFRACGHQFIYDI